jgi:hypothetical protein
VEALENRALWSAAATLAVTGFPSVAVAGSEHSFTVTALDGGGNVVTNYGGTVAVTGGDGQPLLPAPYTFTPADLGTHTFSAALTAAGAQTITAADGSAAGSETGIVITPGPAARLALSLPASAPEGAAPGLGVRALDQYGNTVTNYAGTVHFSDSGGELRLPPDTTFTPSDGGTLALVAQVVRAGADSVTVADLADASIEGTATILALVAPLTVGTPPPPPGVVTASAPGVLAVLLVDPAVGSTASIVAADLPGPPPGLLGVVTYDVRAVGVGSNDRAIITFQVPAGSDPIAPPSIAFFDRVTNTLEPVRPSSLTFDALHSTVTFVLDNSTMPRLQDLTGTVFVVGNLRMPEDGRDATSPILAGDLVRIGAAAPSAGGPVVAIPIVLPTSSPPFVPGPPYGGDTPSSADVALVDPLDSMLEVREAARGPTVGDIARPADAASPASAGPAAGGEAVVAEAAGGQAWQDVAATWVSKKGASSDSCQAAGTEPVQPRPQLGPLYEGRDSTWQQAQAISGGGFPGRPSLLGAMVSAGLLGRPHVKRPARGGRRLS